MTTPTYPSNKPITEIFEATVQYANEKDIFLANKINIALIKDNSGSSCWMIAAFQDIYEINKKPHEIRAIHIYLPRYQLHGRVEMFPALPPEAPIINSASYFRIVNIDYEKKKSDELIYLGKTGVIKYEWSNDFKSIEGNIDLNTLDENKAPININGHFYLSNSGQHSI